MCTNCDAIAFQVLIEADIPKFAKNILHPLLEKFGSSWHTSLYECEEPRGSGTNYTSIELINLSELDANSELGKLVSRFGEILESAQSKNNATTPSTLDGYIEFLDQIELLDLEDATLSRQDFEREILRTWSENRIDYYRSIENLKLQEARNRTYRDIESLPLGGKEEACRTCGVFFFDNLQRHLGESIFYCSIDCEEGAVLVCIQCNIDFVVGKNKQAIRQMKLQGWCSEECKYEFKDARNADRRYISSMQRKAEQMRVEFDETITRREVFLRSGGVCYICKSDTHFESLEEFSPFLATVDHIKPWAKGGAHIWNNVANCCLLCNIRKKDREPDSNEYGIEPRTQ